MCKKIHKGLSILLLFVLISTMFTGCGKKEEPAISEGAKKQMTESEKDSVNKKVKIRMAGIANEEQRKPIFDLIREKLPNIELEYQFISNEQFDSVINTQLAAGQGPDIIEVGAQTKKFSKCWIFVRYIFRGIYVKIS